MKGVAIASILIAALAFCSIVAATPPLIPPVQYEQFCENQKVSGTGVVDLSTSIIDKNLALEYYNTATGDGDFELDQEQAYSQNPDKLERALASTNQEDGHGHHGDYKDDSGTSDVTDTTNDAALADSEGKRKDKQDKHKHEEKTNLNLYENSKMTYKGDTPLVGGKFLHSKWFYGGIGASVQEMFAVNEMEKEQESFFASTTPYKRLAWDKDFLRDLKHAGRNTNKVEKMMGNLPTHLVGIDTKNTFNGTWGTDAVWHKIFYKDIKAHEMFTGKFEAEKLLKFHEYPVGEPRVACEGIDC
jgi:hypothetical protein